MKIREIDDVTLEDVARSKRKVPFVNIWPINLPHYSTFDKAITKPVVFNSHAYFCFCYLMLILFLHVFFFVFGAVALVYYSLYRTTAPCT